MIDHKFLQEVADQLMMRIPDEGAILTIGEATKLADDVQSMLMSLKPSFREANQIDRITSAEDIVKTLKRPGADLLDAVGRLNSAVTSIHMAAFRLARD